MVRKLVKENSITSFCLREWAQVVPLLEQTVCRLGEVQSWLVPAGVAITPGTREASAEGQTLPLVAGKLAAVRLQGPADLSWIWKLCLGENLPVMG